jgi:hypothetical protein
MFQYYYNQTLRKLTLAFGGLFDEIFVSNKTSDGVDEKTNVPLTYCGKEKFIRRLTEASSISNNVKIESVIPRLGFEITNIQYDPERHVSKLNSKLRIDSEGGTHRSYSGVPYNVQFGLYCYSRTIEDNLQIIEQILPYFSPEFIVTLKLNNLDVNVDVPIVLNNVSLNQTYEGDMSTRRSIISTLGFTAKAQIYGKINETGRGIIREADINIFEDDTLYG